MGIFLEPGPWHYEFSKYPDVQVDWLFSGRERKNYFDMEVFGDFQCQKGLTFHSHAGRIQPIKTASKARLIPVVERHTCSRFNWTMT